MSMKDWAKKEVEIACKNERCNAKEGEWDYGCACYKSALKAFNSLCEDRHSGMSISFTQNILNRLIDGKCLTPIEDTEDVWVICNDRDNVKIYQCKRMSSLFKDVDENGNITYSDVDRSCCFDINNPRNTYTKGLVTKIIDEMYPIKMPYMPASKPMKVACEDFLTDKKNGDYDMKGIYYVILPKGERVEINRFFDLRGKRDKEISKEEYESIRLQSQSYKKTN